MTIEKNKKQRILYLSQKVYLKKILKNHHMYDCISVITLMKIDIKLKIANLNYVVFAQIKHIYQFAVESLMYVMFEIRFDIAYAISIMSRYAFNFDKFY